MMLRRHFVAMGLEDWLRACALRHIADNTINAYRRDLLQLENLLQEADAVFDEPELARNQFVWCLKRLSQRNLHPRSLARKLSAWRQYNQFLLDSERCDVFYLTHLSAPKPAQRLPKALHAEPLNQLLDASEAAIESSRLPEKGWRDQALFELLYGSGLRVSEAQALDVNDVFLKEGWVRVIGKGDRERHVPLGKKSIDALNFWLKERLASEGETALFTGKNGKRLGQRRMQQCVDAWAKKFGATQHISPHMLRHSFASHMLQNARDIRAVQEMLGHERLSTTQIYTKLDFDHLAHAYDAAHPRARKKKAQ